MKNPFVLLVGAVTNRPRMVMVAMAVVFAIALFGTTLVTMQTGSDTYIDKDTERGMLLDKYSSTFQSDSIMLIIESDDILNPDVLAYTDRLHRDLADEPYVTGVSGVVDLVKQMRGGMLPGSKAEISMALEGIPEETVERYVPSNLMTISVITLEPGLSQDSQAAVIDNFESIITLSSPPPGVSVIVTGNPAFQQQMSQEMGSSMGQLILIAMILMVIAVGLLFSHVRYRFLSIGIVAAGLVLTFGIMGLVGMQISMVAIAAFPVLIGIGIDYAIQFHSRFDEEARSVPLAQAAKTTITKAGPSVLYAMIATCMGFLAMMISPIPMLRDFGILCIIGVASCYLMALIMVPTVGILLKYRPKYPAEGAGNTNGKTHHIEKYNTALGSVATRVAKSPVPVLILCAMVAFIGFQLDQEIIINTNEDSFVPQDMPAVIDLNKVSRTMGSTSSLPIYVRGDNVIDAQTIAWMYQFQQYEVARNDKITGSASIADILMRYNGGVLPADNSELKTALARIPESEQNRYLSGNSEAIITFSTIDMENEVAMSMIADVQRDLEWNPPPPGVTATVTGMLEMFTNLIDAISRSKITMTLLAFGLIFGFLFLIFRKVGRAATPVIPIMMIVGWNGLIMWLLGIDYTPMTAVLGSMSIGVASEYTILIMERVYEERERGLALLPAITQGVGRIGTAITVSGLTTVFGFAALTMSSFNMIANFGIVTVITVGFSLIGAIIVMPAILVLIGGLEKRKGDHVPPPVQG
ncbi:MAG: RND family transporter [Methanomicrobiales archaeon]|nr:RND family transporter [Methanomicrobiales archaeon]